MKESVPTPAVDWSAFYGQLHRFVAARIRVSSDVDDLVQAVMARAVEKAQTAEIQSSAGWLFGIARNAIADHYRRQPRTRMHSADELEEVEGPASEPLHGRAEVIACLEPVLDSLPAHVKDLLRWADMQERSMQAISTDLQISLTATKSRVRRARHDFIDAVRACCAITVDARSRVTDLEARRGCSTGCRCAPHDERAR
jgi:RNA polymerase sigma-70 factor (ECF subfamily)